MGGSYLAVCDEGWDDLDARVACTALGYDSRSFSELFVLCSSYLIRVLSLEFQVCSYTVLNYHYQINSYNLYLVTNKYSLLILL